MSTRTPTPAMLEAVAGHFRALGDASRLRLLHAIGGEERSVGELVTRTGMAQASVSKQLAQLHATGFVARRRDGLFVRYRLADAKVLQLCELMCGRVERDEGRRARRIAG
ncbi:MAG: metalloregulator ArsR/SmtB family transcription factor [Gemmatimonadaceae bacterium]|nr:metalloregulator ArsR/SmtB family transcription factor [Gemmatimonadaceae bacterium]